MATTNRRVHISREVYRSIKNMNKEELEIYLTNMSASAYNNGVEAMSKAMSQKVVAGLQKTKGIGEKRMNEIIANINKELTNEF